MRKGVAEAVPTRSEGRCCRCGLASVLGLPKRRCRDDSACQEHVYSRVDDAPCFVPQS